MAEKRIVLTVNVFKEHPCVDCGNPYKPNCGNGKFPACDLKQKYKKGLTRETAVERMAKAICLERHACISKGEMCGLCELWRNFSTHAEAALDALLEGK